MESYELMYMEVVAWMKIIMSHIQPSLLHVKQPVNVSLVGPIEHLQIV